MLNINLRDSLWPVPEGIPLLREVRKIVIHYSATPITRHVTAGSIRRNHMAKGWKDIGYHWIIDRNGIVWEGRPEGLRGAHCKGWNDESIGVCWIGGLRGDGTPECNITAAQRTAMTALLQLLHRRYPEAELCGHRDLAPTLCPMLDAKAEWGYIFKHDIINLQKKNEQEN